MGFWPRLVLIIVALVVVSYLLSAVIGLLFWVLIAGAIVGGITAILRHFAGEKELARKPRPREERKLNKSADQALKDLEKRVGKQ